MTPFEAIAIFILAAGIGDDTPQTPPKFDPPKADTQPVFKGNGRWEAQSGQGKNK
jgi:hypothetical protein